jgi:hypothetical protein
MTPTSNRCAAAQPLIVRPFRRQSCPRQAVSNACSSTMSGCRGAGTSTPPRGYARPHGVGSNPARSSAVHVAGQWDLEKSWSEWRNAIVDGHTGPISVALASKPTTLPRSRISVFCSQWTNATCARRCTPMTISRRRRDGAGLQRLARGRRIPHPILNRPTGVGAHDAGLPRPRFLRTPARRVAPVGEERPLVLEAWMPGRQVAWLRRASLHLSTC